MRLPSRRFGTIQRVALRKLRQLDAAVELRDLAAPPGNRLEALHGEREGQHSIRLNDQWRICFVWRTEMLTRWRSSIIIDGNGRTD